MNIKSKIAAERTAFISAMTLATTALIALFSILKGSSSYAPGLEKAKTAEPDLPIEGAETIAEPDFSYREVKLTFAGGVNLGSMLGSSSYGTINGLYAEAGADYFFSGIGDVTKFDDMTFAFVNSVFSDGELEPVEKGEDEAKEWYKAPAGAAAALSLGGVDAVSVANPGVRDYGEDGYEDTKAALEGQDIIWGDSGRAVYYDTKAGIRVAVYPCAYESAPGGIPWIEAAEEKSDFVVICIGGGAGDGSEEERELYRSFIDSGADLVIGTNYGTVGGFEQYGGGYIAYSLGSLINGADKYDEDEACLLSVDMKVTDEGIDEITYTPMMAVPYVGEDSWKPELLFEGIDYEAEVTVIEPNGK